MSDFLRRIWLPTLLFAVPICLFEVFGPGQKDAPLSSWTFYTLIAVPVVWGLTTARHGRTSIRRGAASGALCAVAIVAIAVIIEIMRSAAQPSDGAGGLASFAGALFMILVALILVPIGTGIGVLTAFLQKSGSIERSL